MVDEIGKRSKASYLIRTGKLFNSIQTIIHRRRTQGGIDLLYLLTTSSPHFTHYVMVMDHQYLFV
jgi:hypothetical protein